MKIMRSQVWVWMVSLWMVSVWLMLFGILCNEMATVNGLSAIIKQLDRFEIERSLPR